MSVSRPNLKTSKNDYFSALSPLDAFQMLLDHRIEHDSVHYDDDPHNFNTNASDPNSQDLAHYLNDEHPEICGQIHVLPGTAWRTIVKRHFRLTGKIAAYIRSIHDNYVYDGSAKIGDKPLTHRDVMSRIVRI